MGTGDSKGEQGMGGGKICEMMEGDLGKRQEMRGAKQ